MKIEINGKEDSNDIPGAHPAFGGRNAKDANGGGTLPQQRRDRNILSSAAVNGL